MAAATASFLIAAALQLGANRGQPMLVAELEHPATDQRQLLTTEQMLELATQAQARGDMAIAERVYRALADDPNPEVRVEAMFRHGKMLVQAGHLRDGGLMLRQVVDARPDAIAARLELARALDLLGDKDAAWREMRAVQSRGLPIEVARLVDH